MYLLGDIGGTNLRFSWSKDLVNFNDLRIYSTPRDYKDFLSLVRNYSQFLKKLRIIRVCFGFPGVFDKEKKKLVYSPNLPDYRGKNLERDLSKIIDAKIILENDAVLAGLGEAVFGAGKKFKIFAYLTLSSGIGGAKITNKKVEENIFGFEPGHSLFLIQDKKTNISILEAEELLGGKSIEKFFNKKPEEIKNKNFWERYHKILAIFLINTSLFWSIDKIILGGSIVHKINLLKLNNFLRESYPFDLKIQIKKSKLDNLAGLYGALANLRNFK